MDTNLPVFPSKKLYFAIVIYTSKFIIVYGLHVLLSIG